MIGGHQPGVEVRPLAGAAYAITVRGHGLSVDQPLGSGGTDTAPTPVELFVASVASSVALGAGEFLRQRGIDQDELKVHASFRMTGTDRGGRVESIHLRVTVPRELPARHAPELRVAMAECAVPQSLHEPPEVDIEINDYPSLAPG